MVVGASTTAARAAVARRYAALPSTRRRADATPLLHRRALAVYATASAAESESAGELKFLEDWESWQTLCRA
jgi:hypothetical protein